MVEYLKNRKSKGEYTIDGIIISKNNKYIRNTEGNPEYSIAFKQNVDIYTTKIVNIEWNISKDGVLIPRVEFEPIQHDNVTMTFATGFNAKFILDNALGPGSLIEIVRSGDVIPYINGVIESTTPQFPDMKYVWDKNHVHILVTSNKDELTLVKRITNFVKTVEIKYIDEKIISRIVNSGLKTINDFLKIKKEDLLKIDGISDTLADKIITQLNTKLNDLELSTLMVASNVWGHGLGLKKAQKFILHFPNFLNETPEVDDIAEVEGFKDITAEMIHKNIKTFKNWLKETKLTYKMKKVSPKNNKLKDIKIVFSGFRDKELEKKIIDYGGIIGNTISKNTDYLIVKDINNESSKIVKAKDLGVKIITIEEFNLI
jgi:NAD-dependent DNA ligase